MFCFHLLEDNPHLDGTYLYPVILTGGGNTFYHSNSWKLYTLWRVLAKLGTFRECCSCRILISVWKRTNFCANRTELNHWFLQPLALNLHKLEFILWSLILGNAERRWRRSIIICGTVQYNTRSMQTAFRCVILWLSR